MFLQSRSQFSDISFFFSVTFVFTVCKLCTCVLVTKGSGEASSEAQAPSREVLSQEVPSCEAPNNVPNEALPNKAECSKSTVMNTVQEQDGATVKKEMETVFAWPENVSAHNRYKCSEDCHQVSKQEQSRLRNLSSRDRFVHSWLSDRDLSFCQRTGIYWLVYEEGRGMFCFLCKKHDTENTKNRSKVYNSTPSVRYKKSAVHDHSLTQQHRDAIQAEMLSRVSQFHKEFKEKEKVQDQALNDAFLAAYWVAKEEIANRKFSSLIDLLKIMSHNGKMKYFQYSGQETVRDIFLALGSALLEKLLEKVKKAGCYGLLTDEVTDVSVLEMLMTFVQFFNSDTGKVETHFLFVEDILKNSNSANAEAIFNILTEKLDTLGLQRSKLSSMASDGAAVMTGKRSGVATRLKALNRHVITFHCLCHKLALACTDTNSEVHYIKNVELWLRQLWKMFENSPKRTATYMKVQLQLKSLQLSENGKKVVTKKLKKACQTRWLSFDAATAAIFDDYLAVLQTLRQLKDEDAIACGLLGKVKSAKFIGTIYILKAVLPVLSSLSKTFQKGSVNFSHITPSVNYTIGKLSEIAESKSPITELKEHLLPTTGRLNFSDVTLTNAVEQELSNLLSNYVNSLKDNIHRRFEDALPVVSAFAIFDPLAIPNPGSPGFKGYGSQQVKTMADHFYSDEPDKEARVDQLKAEWEKFKYDLASWKGEIPKEVKESHSTTTTEWCLTRLVALKTSYSLVFPALVPIAEVCLSMPVSNAWPERGCSALKRVKTRLRSRLNVDMLQSLLAITINGPEVGSPECESMVSAAVEHWESMKVRRKLPRDKAKALRLPSPTKETEATRPQVVQAGTDAAVQTGGSEDELLHDVEATLQFADALLMEVEVATAALKLAPDIHSFPDLHSDLEFDSEDEDF